jgi:hypothetical protein
MPAAPQDAPEMQANKQAVLRVQLGRGEPENPFVAEAMGLGVQNSIFAEREVHVGVRPASAKTEF